MLATDDRSTVLAPPPCAAGVPPVGAAGIQRAPLAGAAAATLVIGYLSPALAFHLRGLRGPLGIEDRTASGEGYALTFDDGPHAQGTPATLEILAAADVRATFFLVGEQVQRNPGLVGEIVAAGHEVGLHCHRHRNLLRLTPWQVREDLARVQAIVEDASGRASTLYRPPYGIFNAAALAIARNRGWRPLLWSHWGRDWDFRASAASIASLVTDGAREGAVLLLHDADDYSAPSSWRRTVAALPRVLETLEQRGLQPVSP